MIVTNQYQTKHLLVPIQIQSSKLYNKFPRLQNVKDVVDNISFTFISTPVKPEASHEVPHLKDGVTEQQSSTGSECGGQADHHHCEGQAVQELCRDQDAPLCQAEDWSQCV